MIRPPPQPTPLPLHAPLPISHLGRDVCPARRPPAECPRRMTDSKPDLPIIDIAQDERRLSWTLRKIKRYRGRPARSEEHTSELQSRLHLVCRLLLEKKKAILIIHTVQHETEVHSTLHSVVQPLLTPINRHPRITLISLPRLSYAAGRAVITLWKLYP